MPFRTLLRAAIMLGVLVVVVKGWLAYGPSHEQVATLVLRAVEAGDGLLGKFREPAPAPIDPRTGLAPSAAAPAVLPPPTQRLPPTGVTPPRAGVVLASGAAAAAPRPASLAATDTRLEAALARLEQLGATEHELQPWGSSGRLYRFCCSAAWGGSPGYGRHFEAIAAEPLAAVQQVVDQVAAWRAAGHDARDFR